MRMPSANNRMEGTRWLVFTAISCAFVFPIVLLIFIEVNEKRLLKKDEEIVARDLQSALALFDKRIQSHQDFMEYQSAFLPDETYSREDFQDYKYFQGQEFGKLK